MYKILWTGPLSVNFKLAVLLKNHVEWVFPPVFNWRHLYANCPTDIYLVKVNNRNTRTRCEKCSKLTIKTPNAKWRCSGVILTPVRGKALQTFSSKVLSRRPSETGFISIFSLLWYRRFVTAFLFSWIILCNKWELQFFDICDSE